MKKSKNTISDWLDKYGDPEIDKKVEEELEHMKKYKVKLVILNENDEPQISSVFTSDVIDDMKTFRANQFDLHLAISHISGALFLSV